MIGARLEFPKDMPHVKRVLLLELWKTIKDKAIDGRWRKYTVEFFWEDLQAVCVMSCYYRLDNMFLQLRDYKIEQKVIEIDVHDMEQKGWLN